MKIFFSKIGKPVIVWKKYEEVFLFSIEPSLKIILGLVQKPKNVNCSFTLSNILKNLCKL